MSRSLKGGAAFVTGGAGGIGEATCQVLAERGARFVVADINQTGERVAGALRVLGAEALAVHFDLADERSIIALFIDTIRKFGRLDVLDNYAGPAFARTCAAGSRHRPDGSRSLGLHLRGECARHHDLLPRGAEDHGEGGIRRHHQHRLQSRAAGQHHPGGLRASKAAIIQMTRSIATSHGKAGIRCNAILPGLTASPAALNNLPKRLHEIVLEETLTPFLGEPLDIAYTVVFLVSDEARYITGQVIVADGGTSAHIPGVARLREMMAGGEGF